MKPDKRVTILSLQATEPIMISVLRIIDEINNMGYCVDHHGISFYKWYDKRQKYVWDSLKIKKYALSRPSGAATAWWHTPHIYEEVEVSYALILEEINKILDSCRPDLLVISDDTGLLEMALIRQCNNRKIPVVLLEHGFGYVCEHIWNNSLRKKLGKLRYRIKNRLLEIFMKSAKNKTCSFPLPKVNNFGKNGDYKICCYSDWTAKILLKTGIDKRNIYITGYNYFDEIFKNRIENKINNKKNILIVSTGFGVEGQKAIAEKFYKIVVDIYNTIKKEYCVVLRLKRGENYNDFLKKDLADSLNNLDITFDDNGTFFFESLIKYDLIISESPTSILEAVINHIPFIAIDLRPVFFMSTYVVRKMFKAILYREGDDIIKKIKQAFEENYIKDLICDLKKNERYLFHRLDGKSSERIARVCIETLDNSKRL